jgi:hypothetical protein
MAYVLLEAEKTFRRIKGCKDIHKLLKCLEKLPTPHRRK